MDPTAQHAMNYACLSSVIATVCTDCLRDVLLTHLPHGYGDLHNFLLANKPRLTAMRQLRREQLNCLFPDPAGSIVGTVDQFDLTLLYTLIRTLSTVPAPVSGWGKQPSDRPRDQSIGANIERIRTYRNAVHGLTLNARIDDQTFADYWDEIRTILDDIELIIGPKGYQATLKKQKDLFITSQDTQSLKKKINECKYLTFSRKAIQMYIICTITAVITSFEFNSL